MGLLALLLLAPLAERLDSGVLEAWSAAIEARLQQCEVVYEIDRYGPADGATTRGRIQRVDDAWKHYQAIFDTDGGLYLKTDQIVTDQVIVVQQRPSDPPRVTGYIDARPEKEGSEGYVFRPVKATQSRLGFLFGFLEDDDRPLPELFRSQPWRVTNREQSNIVATNSGIRYEVGFRDGRSVPGSLVRTTAEGDIWEFRVTRYESEDLDALPVEYDFRMVRQGKEFDRGKVRIVSVQSHFEASPDPLRPFALTLEVEDPAPASLKDLRVAGTLRNLRLEAAVADSDEDHRFNSPVPASPWLIVVSVAILSGLILLVWRNSKSGS